MAVWVYITHCAKRSVCSDFQRRGDEIEDRNVAGEQWISVKHNSTFKIK